MTSILLAKYVFSHLFKRGEKTYDLLDVFFSLDFLENKLSQIWDSLSEKWQKEIRCLIRYYCRLLGTGVVGLKFMKRSQEVHVASLRL